MENLYNPKKVRENPCSIKMRKELQMRLFIMNFIHHSNRTTFLTALGLKEKLSEEH